MMGSIEEFNREAWCLHPVLDVPDLYPPAVLFSILDSDPRPKYKEYLNRMSEKHRDQVSDPASPLDPQLMRQSQLSVAWDSVFHEVPGDKITFLFQNQEQQGNGKSAGSAAGPGPKYLVMIKSNAPAGTTWLVTRATRFKNKPVCWCMPVEVERGKTTEVSLTVHNMIDLETE